MDPLHSRDTFQHIPILECMPVTVHVLHKFSTVTTSSNIAVLTGLFLAWTVFVFMINLHITELHNKPGGSMHVMEVIFLLVSMCVLSKGD